MKYLLLAAVLAVPLLAQSETVAVIAGLPNDKVYYSIAVDPVLGKAYLRLALFKCTPVCVPENSISDRQIVNLIKGIVDEFDEDYADFERRIDFNGKSAAPAAAAVPMLKPQAATVANPQLIALSGYGDNNVSLLDLKTNVKSNTVILPNGMDQTFGVRSTLTGPSREVWTHHSSGTGIGFTGGKMVITNLDTASIVASIPTNTTADANFTCINIVFTNNGKTAYCASTEPSPDADGYYGGMWIFDAEARQLKSHVRLPLVQIDSAVMAPDGLTIFLTGTAKPFGEQIVYYDVLTGTAELSVLLQEPLAGTSALFNYLSPTGKPLVHPDGNRLFILYSYQVKAGQFGDAYAVSVFDLSQRKLVNKFPVTFSSGGKALKLDLSQDGTLLTVLSNGGEVQLMDPLSGSVVGTYQGPATSVDIFTTPLIP